MHYAVEPVSLGTWVFEPKGKQRSKWNADQVTIFLGKEMKVHFFWPWIVMGGIDTLCQDYTLESPKGFYNNRTSMTGEVKVQRVNLSFWKAVEGCLKLVAQPYGWYRN